MNYQEAVRHLYQLPRGRVRLDLERIEAALSLRGHPQRRLPVVHVAGTNGKGSVSATVAAIAKAAGLKTGLFTSPHLHRFVERIRLDGRPLAERKLARRVSELRRFQAADPNFPELSFFETATLLAFETFRDERCDLVVLEVGLGGRLDATNVIDRPLVTAITRIAKDHAAILGGSLARIAREKAGILKPGRPLVSTVVQPQARRAIEERASELGVPTAFLGEAFDVTPSNRVGRIQVAVGDERFADLQPGLLGTHQQENIACAVAIAWELRGQGYAIDESAVVRGVRNVRWPGRLEWIGASPRILLDAAHNPDGCSALARYLGPRGRRRRVLVFGAMEDKEVEAMLTRIAPKVHKVVFAPLPMDRAASVAALRRRAPNGIPPSRGSRSIDEALRIACCDAGEDGEVVVAGSLFLLAEARANLLGCASEPLTAS